ncbi:hypothetical protein EV178_004440 [Coemansia sp. RSA 1646]|nr:hypothetical protein EV178_004440 [Coemansia sp. RSA 1646]KAJ1768372.1 hypothetical protein LPJ74_004900 [Coemansia sp. RSA 1843]KAJ2212897.1 hypothetical protein EV179_004298 [Coemansia sp. RSA 487]
MGGFYTIAGRKVATHHMVLGMLGLYGLGIKAALPKTDKTQNPPINAANEDEGKFVQEFLKSFEAEEKKTAH